MLLANAGTGTPSGWSNLDLRVWQHTLAVALTAPLLLAHKVLPAMVERQSGGVLFFSSVAALNDGVIGPVASGFQEPDSTTGAPHDRSAEGRRS